MISTLGPFLLAASIQVATTTTVPQDTYRYEGVRVILTTAAAAREGIYVGLNVARFRRERGLFDGERVARIRWDRGGDRYIE